MMIRYFSAESPRTEQTRDAAKHHYFFDFSPMLTRPFHAISLNLLLFFRQGEGSGPAESPPARCATRAVASSRDASVVRPPGSSVTHERAIRIGALA
jgi:hypothetical protein